MVIHTINSLLLSAVLLLVQDYVHCAENQGNLSIVIKKNQDVTSSVVTVTSYDSLPYSSISNESGRWIGKGYAFRILDIVSLHLKFKYIIVPPNGNCIGNKKTGILGLVHQKKVDMAAVLLPTFIKISPYGVFSQSLVEENVSVLMKRNNKSSINTNLFTSFDTTVWLLILASSVFVGQIVYFFTQFRAKLWHEVEFQGYSLFFCYWFIYTSMLKQTTQINTTTDSIRLLFATWWIFVLILTCSYTAQLTAVATVSTQNEKKVQWESNWTTSKRGLVHFLLANQDNLPDGYNKLKVSHAQGRSSFVSFSNTTDVVSFLNNSTSFFVAEELYLRNELFKSHNYAKQLRCKYFIKSFTDKMGHGFVFPYNSTIKEKIDSLFQKLVEAGIVQHIIRYDNPIVDICPKKQLTKKKALNNKNISFLYEVILMGYGISTMLFIMELILSFALNRPELRRTKNKARKTEGSSNGKPLVRQNILIKSNDHLFLEKRISLLKIRPRTIYRNRRNNVIQRRKSYFNGRIYHVITNHRNGQRRLIPIRTLSAFLFQKLI